MGPPSGHFGFCRWFGVAGGEQVPPAAPLGWYFSYNCLQKKKIAWGLVLGVECLGLEINGFYGTGKVIVVPYQISINKQMINPICREIEELECFVINLSLKLLPPSIFLYFVRADFISH